MRIGFIGAGNIAKAMIEGLCKGYLVNNEDIMVNCITQSKLKNIESKYNVRVSSNKEEVVNFSDYIIIAVKPHQINKVKEEICSFNFDNKIIISTVAGLSINDLEEMFGCKQKIIRIMPNTSAIIGESMTALCYNSQVESEEVEKSKLIMNEFGEVEVIDEKNMDAVIAVSGSSPAYVYMFIEAMADGAVYEGMNRDLAYKFAAQAVFGSAKMVLELGKHPGVLKDQVCSPGGTTIEAVKVLEEKGLRSAIINAMKACADKSRDL